MSQTPPDSTPPDSTPARIGFDDFLKVDIRVGTIVQAEPFPEARKPAIRLWVDFGAPLGIRKSSAQITRHYTPEGLVGRQVVAVVNFPPRQIGPVMSEVLVLGVPDPDGQVVLLRPDLPVPDGGRMF
ncbi:tRNA-binding protein [Rhodocista pekingensis]|uniref:tRNA-binding protein n=1 Tax=Rhodocista pekingensis TaxID=201185 RepID=A0ABW2KWS0_9PROT